MGSSSLAIKLPAPSAGAAQAVKATQKRLESGALSSLLAGVCFSYAEQPNSLLHTRVSH